MASWLNRADLTAEIPGFIQLAEKEIGRLVRRKTLRNNLTISAYATDLVVGLTSFGELRSLRLVTTSPTQDAPIDIGTPEQLAELRQRVTTAGRPVRGAVVGNELLVGPSPDQAYTAEATYFEKLQALSALNPSNSLLLEAPDIYLWGALKCAEPFLENDARIPTWEKFFDRGVAQINKVREDEEFSASMRPVRLPVVYGG